VEKLAALSAKHGVPFVLNPAPAQKLAESLLAKADVLIPNESEAQALTGLSDPEEAGHALAALGPPLVIVTLGKEGCLAVTKSRVEHYPAQKVEAVDTVAAGDCFVGVFCAVMADGGSPEECIRWAQAAAALSVTRKGAQPSLPTRAEVVAFLDRCAGE
jgi:ribokinase